LWGTSARCKRRVYIMYGRYARVCDVRFAKSAKNAFARRSANDVSVLGRRDYWTAIRISTIFLNVARHNNNRVSRDNAYKSNKSMYSYANHSFRVHLRDVNISMKSDFKDAMPPFKAVENAALLLILGISNVFPGKRNPVRRILFKITRKSRPADTHIRYVRRSPLVRRMLHLSCFFFSVSSVLVRTRVRTAVFCRVLLGFVDCLKPYTRNIITRIRFTVGLFKTRPYNRVRSVRESIAFSVVVFISPGQRSYFIWVRGMIGRCADEENASRLLERRIKNKIYLVTSNNVRTRVFIGNCLNILSVRLLENERQTQSIRKKIKNVVNESRVYYALLFEVFPHVYDGADELFAGNKQFFIFQSLKTISNIYLSYCLHDVLGTTNRVDKYFYYIICC